MKTLLRIKILKTSTLKVLCNLHCGSEKMYRKFWVTQIMLGIICINFTATSALGGIAHPQKQVELVANTHLISVYRTTRDALLRFGGQRLEIAHS